VPKGQAKHYCGSNKQQAEISDSDCAELVVHVFNVASADIKSAHLAQSCNFAALNKGLLIKPTPRRLSLCPF
jgi:hypothetical protein